MHRYCRKTTPRVVRGKVQRKNRSAPTPNYYNTLQDVPVFDRRRPGVGFRHLLRKNHLLAFISILPDWAELSRCLDAVVLAPGDRYCDGWHTTGVVAICAWPREMRAWYERSYYEAHRNILTRLEVPVVHRGAQYLCDWTETTARAFQLLHVLLHELGHHHDRMSTKSQRRTARGEGYAERYAAQYGQTIWDRYFEMFWGE